MKQLILTLTLIIVCATFAYGRHKSKSPVACEAYINERWTAEQNALQTSRENFKKLQASGLLSLMNYADLKVALPILQWQYSRKHSKKCRKVLSNDVLSSEARQMERVSKKVSDVKWQAVIQQGMVNASRAAETPAERSCRELGTQTVTLRDYYGNPVTITVPCQ